MEEDSKIFDQRLNFPDTGASKRFEALVGIDEIKTRLTKSLGVLVNLEGLRLWNKEHHPTNNTLISLVERRPPLIILAGDVGTGKTELASTIGDPVARKEDIEITLLSLSLSTRGSGRVGEMTKLLSEAFGETYKEAQNLKNKIGKNKGAIILLVDEADAIVQSRENEQMHHEDRAGVNAFIRGIDRFAEEELPAVVILCTNRLSAIDPAVQRRAAEILIFNRPNDEQRLFVLEKALANTGFTKKQMTDIVELTGPTENCNYGFTYSDLTQRLLPTLVLDAYPNSPITFKRAKEILESMHPTAPFQELK